MSGDCEVLAPPFLISFIFQDLVMYHLTKKRVHSLSWSTAWMLDHGVLFLIKSLLAILNSSGLYIDEFCGL